MENVVFHGYLIDYLIWSPTESPLKISHVFPMEFHGILNPYRYSAVWPFFLLWFRALQIKLACKCACIPYRIVCYYEKKTARGREIFIDCSDEH